MGIFASLFSSKQSPPAPSPAAKPASKPAPRVAEPQRVVATSGTPVARAGGAGGISVPKPVASGAALQMPQPVLPRSITQRLMQRPALPAPRSDDLTTGRPDTPASPGEIAMTLADIVSQIPPDRLVANASMDLTRIVYFPLAEVSAELARGRPAVSLTTVVCQFPEIFRNPEAISPAEMVRLPLQKLLVEIGRFKRSPQENAPRALPAARIDQPQAPAEVTPRITRQNPEPEPKPLVSWLRAEVPAPIGDPAPIFVRDDKPEPVESVPLPVQVPPESKVIEPSVDSTLRPDVIEIVPTMVEPAAAVVDDSASASMELALDLEAESHTEILEIDDAALVEIVDFSDPALKLIPDQEELPLDFEYRPELKGPVAVESNPSSRNHVELESSSSLEPEKPLVAQEMVLKLADTKAASEPELAIEEFVEFPVIAQVAATVDHVDVTVSEVKRTEESQIVVAAPAPPAPPPAPVISIRYGSNPPIPKFPLRPPRSGMNSGPSTDAKNGRPKATMPISPVFAGHGSRTELAPQQDQPAKSPTLFGANPLDRYFSTKTPPPPNWEAAGTLLGISGEVTLSRIAEAISTLPEITGCLLVAPPDVTIKGNWPATSQADNSVAFARRLAGVLRRGVNGLIQRQIMTDFGVILVFAIDDILICAVSRSHVLPGLRERLSVVTKAISYARKVGSPSEA